MNTSDDRVINSTEMREGESYVEPSSTHWKKYTAVISSANPYSSRSRSAYSSGSVAERSKALV